MDAQSKLGSALFSELTKLRERKGSFDMADVGALFEEASATLHTADSSIDRSLQQEISQLALFINQAKSEILSVGNSTDSKNATGDAALHLDAVIKGTEEASHTIMDAADVIQSAASNVGGEPQKIIGDAITKIYEACNFQDLTGQRVNKVIKILGEIDTRINTMLALFGGQSALPGAPKKETASGDEKLLNGPQLPGKAPSQAEIDALFGDQ